MNESRDPLDDLLANWSQTRTRHCDAQHLARQIAERAGPQSFAAEEDILPSHGRKRHFAFAAATFAGLAALLSAIMLWIGLESDEIAKSQRMVLPSIDREVLKTLHELFPEGLAWVAETDSGFSLGTHSHREISRAKPDIAVRLELFARTAGQGWVRQWHANLLTIPEELFRFDDQKTNVRLWTCRMPDGAIAIEESLALRANGNIIANIAVVQIPGDSGVVWSGSAGSVELRLVQSVAQLGADDEG